MDPEIIHDEFPALSGKKSNYYKHRKTALRWIQLLSGKEWTDYNAHDPGVTILETLCYALTEIEYKLGFSIEDILYGLPGTSKNPLKENAFYLAEDILTTAPVTEGDYRRLLIDRVDEVNNAWLIQDEEEKDVFKVLLLTKEDASDVNAIKSTTALLDKYRSYGTKFSAIQIAEFEYIPLNLDIYVDNQHDVEATLAKMFFNLNEAILNPDPTRQPFNELVEEGVDYQDIFDGPKMGNGIIKKESLAPKISELSAIKIKKIIASTPGIEMIDHFYVTSTLRGYANKAQESSDITEKETIKIGSERVPFFSPDKKLANNTIRVYKNQEPIKEIDSTMVHELLIRMALKTKRDYKLKNKNRPPSYSLHTRNRNIQDYYSIQNDFPSVYGLQNKGYSVIQNFKSHNSDQLKAYLLPFEQLLANTFMRLAKLRELFSIYPINQMSAHTPLSIPFLKSKNNESELVYETSKSYDHCIEEIDEEELLKLTRKHKYLVHLLARFDLHLYEDFEIDYADGELSHLYRDIEGKQWVLDNVDRITANRGVFDRHDTRRGLTSLEEEIYRRLGIQESPLRPLYKSISGLNYKIGKKKFCKKRKSKEAGSFSSFKIKRPKKKNREKEIARFYTKGKANIKDILKIGSDKLSYNLIPHPKGKGYRIVLVDEAKKMAQKICALRSKDTALEFIGSLVQELKSVSQKSEGFYLVDHALLEDPKNDKMFAHYRMSFVFTAWGAHFQNRSFQKKTQDLLHYLVPAHVRADCIWLDLDDMKIFEKTYQKWERSCSKSKQEKTKKHAKKLKVLLSDYVETKIII